MKVVYLPEDGTNFIPYEVMGKNIDFNDGDLMFLSLIHISEPTRH